MTVRHDVLSGIRVAIGNPQQKATECLSRVDPIAVSISPRPTETKHESVFVLTMVDGENRWTDHILLHFDYEGGVVTDMSPGFVFRPFFFPVSSTIPPHKVFANKSYVGGYQEVDAGIRQSILMAPAITSRAERSQV